MSHMELEEVSPYRYRIAYVQCGVAWYVASGVKDCSDFGSVDYKYNNIEYGKQ